MLLKIAEEFRNELIKAKGKNKNIYLSNAIRLMSGVIGNLKRMQ